MAESNMTDEQMVDYLERFAIPYMGTSGDYIRSIAKRLRELSAPRCHSCGANCNEREDLCGGCHKLTCYVCVEAFDHNGDGSHGNGDPSDWVSDLIGEHDSLAEWKARFIGAMRRAVENRDALPALRSLLNEAGASGVGDG